MTYPISILRRFRAACTLLLVALVLVILPGCDDEELLPVEPDTDAEAGPLFNRYVAIGNSITAGFQSGGINEDLQEDAYPVLLAEQMGTRFFIPRINNPGCPPPLVQIFPEPVTIAPSVECALRETPLPPFINNVAVPGAEVVDAVSNLDPSSNSNPLTTLILGGRTQLQAALAADPTFVTVWIGNNDVLGAALAGNPQFITDGPAFQERYTQLLEGLDAAGNLEGGLLFGVADVTRIPALSAGLAYFVAVPQAQQASDLVPDNFTIAPSCAPAANGGVGDQTLVPFRFGAGALSLARGLADLFNQVEEQAGQELGDPPNITLDCADNTNFGDLYRPVVDQFLNNLPLGEEQRDSIAAEIEAGIAGSANTSILTAQEIGALAATVQAYNQFIQVQAQQRSWAYLDVNPLFGQFADQVPRFPELIDNPETPWGPDTPFGPLFSLDGVHPSSLAHQEVANAAIEAINAHYNASIPAL